jgi:hypothetical protein
MSHAATLIEKSSFSDASDEQKLELVEMLDAYATQQDFERSNLLRSILEDAGARLMENGPVDEIAAQLLDAAEASFKALLDQNVEIEIDDDLGSIHMPPSRPQIHGDPVLAALYHATRLRDGIAALQISGTTPSDERRAEFQKALLALKDTLNSHLKG